MYYCRLWYQHICRWTYIRTHKKMQPSYMGNTLWYYILLHFMCYHPLESVFVSGMTLPDDEDFLEKTPEQEGYLLEFPLESIDDLEEFADRVFQKTYGEMTFWFASLDMMFHYFRDDVYLLVTLKKVTEENKDALGLLKKIVEAKGLFLV